ncbi:cytochrome oxidase assembly protein-domain-containing protein [Paraphysoderma sedebokerense]|nr:cytochrome oxidase assembly protein-domain-containing protein [Paraphysoderma sedebokerense]
MMLSRLGPRSAFSTITTTASSATSSLPPLSLTARSRLLSSIPSNYTQSSALRSLRLASPSTLHRPQIPSFLLSRQSHWRLLRHRQPRLKKFYSTSPPPPAFAPSLPLVTYKISHPVTGYWLLFTSSLVFSIVVVGGITRLTESGLSITEWNLIRGMKWPSSQDEWIKEFDKYRVSPEGVLLNPDITMSEFKYIFYWEWFHRMLGRAIGLVIAVPAIYFTFSRPSANRVKNLLKLVPSSNGAAAAAANTAPSMTVDATSWMTPRVVKTVWGLTALVGFQGALGWYMVKSGLHPDLLETPNATPRVSQYRLAAHLGSAFMVYLGGLWTGMRILKEWKIARTGTDELAIFLKGLDANQVAQFKKFGKATHWVAGLVFLTSIVGAFVAGLDAGLVYNTWPLMGDNFVPPSAELFPKVIKSSVNGQIYTQRSLEEDAEWDQTSFLGKVAALFSGKEGRWKNIFENQVTVQTEHRLLAYTTFAAITSLFVYGRRIRLPKPVKNSVNLVMAAALAQVTLGITTLIYFVPMQLAAAHQAGSLVLLSTVLVLMNRVRGSRVAGSAKAITQNFKSKSI